MTIKYGFDRTYRLTLWTELKRSLRRNHNIKKEILIQKIYME